MKVGLVFTHARKKKSASKRIRSARSLSKTMKFQFHFPNKNNHRTFLLSDASPIRTFATSHSHLVAASSIFRSSILLSKCVHSIEAVQLATFFGLNSVSTRACARRTKCLSCFPTSRFFPFVSSTTFCPGWIGSDPTEAAAAAFPPVAARTAAAAIAAVTAADAVLPLPEEGLRKTPAGGTLLVVEGEYNWGGGSSLLFVLLALAEEAIGGIENLTLARGGGTAAVVDMVDEEEEEVAALFPSAVIELAAGTVIEILFPAADAEDEAPFPDAALLDPLLLLLLLFLLDDDDADLLLLPR
jgi:hypothetical protein